MRASTREPAAPAIPSAGSRLPHYSDARWGLFGSHGRHARCGICGEILASHALKAVHLEAAHDAEVIRRADGLYEWSRA